MLDRKNIIIYTRGIGKENLPSRCDRIQFPYSESVHRKKFKTNAFHKLFVVELVIK